jgi:hypothetical protein
MQLFLLVVGCDVALGPLISFVIYNPPKGRAKIIFDYTVVGCLQLAALCYGIFVVAQSRPVFIAFDSYTFEIVSAIELEDGDLIAASKPEYRVKSLLGPRLVSVQRPTDPRELADVVIGLMSGLSPALKPKYYRAYEDARDLIRNRSATIESLIEGSGAVEAQLNAAIAKTKRDAADLGWFVAHHRFGTAVALIDRETGAPVGYIPIDPKWVKEKKLEATPASVRSPFARFDHRAILLIGTNSMVSSFVRL